MFFFLLLSISNCVKFVAFYFCTIKFEKLRKKKYLFYLGYHFNHLIALEVLTVHSHEFTCLSAKKYPHTLSYYYCHVDYLAVICTFLTFPV